MADAPPDAPWYVRHRMRALLVLIAAWLAFCAIIFSVSAFWFMSKVRNSEPYAMALERVRSDADAQRLLGQPIEPGWLTLGSVSDGNGYAEFNMRFNGPNGTAGARVIAEKDDAVGPWVLVFLDLGFRDGRVITLINDKPPTGPDLPQPLTAP